MAKILIAEDEPDIRQLIRITLNYAGHEVVVTTNGEEALKEAKNIIPDLVILDVRMPRLSGYETCQQIKADKNLSHVPVVFLSAKGQEAEVNTGLEAGAIEYILKPFSPDELIERVSVILSSNGHKI
jgi:DNA-binding response OmpR family regulator